jgi:hypothetical protein
VHHVDVELKLDPGLAAIPGGRPVGRLRVAGGSGLALAYGAIAGSAPWPDITAWLMLHKRLVWPLMGYGEHPVMGLSSPKEESWPDRI